MKIQKYSCIIETINNRKIFTRRMSEHFQDFLYHWKLEKQHGLHDLHHRRPVLRFRSTMLVVRKYIRRLRFLHVLLPDICLQNTGAEMF